LFVAHDHVEEVAFVEETVRRVGVKTVSERTGHGTLLRFHQGSLVKT